MIWSRTRAPDDCQKTWMEAQKGVRGKQCNTGQCDTWRSSFPFSSGTPTHRWERNRSSNNRDVRSEWMEAKHAHVRVCREMTGKVRRYGVEEDSEWLGKEVQRWSLLLHSYHRPSTCSSALQAVQDKAKSWQVSSWQGGMVQYNTRVSDRASRNGVTDIQNKYSWIHKCLYLLKW